MTLCGLRPCLNMSEKQTLYQDLNMTHPVAEFSPAHHLSDLFPFLNVENLETYILGGFSLLLSMFGLVGNGIVLWFFCFCLKGNSFIFVTNLAVADFGVLFGLFIYYSVFFIVYLYSHAHNVVCMMNLCIAALDFVMFSASALFLAAISADRCVAVFFPLWHRWQRPKYLPTIVSALIWALAFMAGGILFYCTVWIENVYIEVAFFFLLDFFIILFISTLLIRVYCYSKICRKGRLLKVVLLALFVFIITLIPQNFLLLFMKDSKQAFLITDFLTCVNSSANPVIYFFIGRHRSGPFSGSVTVALKKVFSEDDEYGGRPSSSKTSVQTT